MGFWIFLLLMLLIIPVTMIGFGKYFMNTSPKNIGFGFGYRTSMSMKNKDTWQFAHRYIGKLWYRIGWILIPATVLHFFFSIGKDRESVGNFALILNIVQMLCLVAPIFPTERALKDTFDRNGFRKKKH